MEWNVGVFSRRHSYISKAVLPELSRFMNEHLNAFLYITSRQFYKYAHKYVEIIGVCTDTYVIYQSLFSEIDEFTIHSWFTLYFLWFTNIIT